MRATILFAILLTGCTALIDPGEVCCGGETDAGDGDAGDGTRDAGDGTMDAGDPDMDAGDRDAGPETDAGDLTDAGTADAGVQPDVVRVTAGLNHSCAALSDGRVACWGDNRAGQVTGRGTSAPLPPTAVPLRFTNVDDLCAGDAFSCATNGNEVFCWGDDTRGQLGDGAPSSHTEPVPVMGIPRTGITQVVCGGRHACALAVGVAYCWGDNSTGQASGTPMQRLTAGRVSPSPMFDRIAAGTQHTCGAALTSGVTCWGDNTSHQTCPTGACRLQNLIRTPVEFLAIGGITHLGLGEDFTCLGMSSLIRCFSDRTEMTMTPPVMSLLDLTGGSRFACALHGTSVGCWGSMMGAVADLPSGGEQIDAGDQHICVAAGRRAYCWGLNAFGRIVLGPGVEMRPRPIDLSGI